WTQIAVDFRARNRAERVMRTILLIAAAIAILTTIGIVLSLIGETLIFFQRIGWNVDSFLFGTTWSPLSGVQEGSLDPSKVGAVPLFVGTLMITIIAMCVAVPVGLFAAVYLADFASKRTRSWAKPLLEILAGVPTVVYGYFAAITVAPALRDFGSSIGLSIASESALAAGVVMGIMIIPFISSLSDDVINSVPQSLRDGSYGLGATKAETVRRVVLPAALPGIVSAVLLGTSRAIGETMIVVMAAGQGANMTINPLDAVTTVTVQIVMLITGDTEAATAAAPAFTLGFTLFCVTLVLNVVALRVVRRYREMYD
ncbi:MAG: phosphate ABC transporter permease subunit PstC, partial [Pseudomonadota bacterium]